MAIHGLAYFPGINQIVEASIDFTVGITPSIASLTIAPQYQFLSQVGTLVFSDGNVRIEWPNARLDTNSFERNDKGLVWRLAVQDRRWLWQSTGGGGIVFGGANLRYDDASLITSTERSPQDIAKACLDAMFEYGYDVSDLPNDDRPEIMWDGGLPAEKLMELCELYGFQIVLGLDNRVRLCRVGVGNDLPSVDVLTDSLSMTVPGLPSQIAAVCAPDKFDVCFELEAVGLELDGSLKLLNDLSYKPSGGWANSDIGYFYDVLDQFGTRYQNLAKRSVYRYYRVKLPVQIPGYTNTHGEQNAQISDAWKIRLEETRAQQIEEDGKKRSAPAFIYGCYFNENEGLVGNNVTATDIAPYQTDPNLLGDDEDPDANNHTWQFGSEGEIGSAKHHYVVFDRPMYKSVLDNSLSSGFEEAKLYLYTSCTILDEYTFSPVRSYFWRNTGSSLQTLPRFELFEDLQVVHYFDLTQSEFGDNYSEVEQDADYYINGLIQHYQTTTPRTISYAGLKYIELDGAIMHLHFQISAGGTTTTASRNTEQIHRIQPLAYRKLMSKIKSGVREMAKNTPTLRKFRKV